MKKSRFSEEQIITVLKEHQAGIAVADICRKHGITMPRSTIGAIAMVGWKCPMHAG